MVVVAEYVVVVAVLISVGQMHGGGGSGDMIIVEQNV